MIFKNLSISKWQQFENIDIDFHERLTVLTGANASGKTTILNLLGKHCGWDAPSLAVPRKNLLASGWKWLTRFLKGSNEETELGPEIGAITYDNETQASFRVPQQNSAQYNVELSNRQDAKCFFIPSHRAVFRYQEVTTLQTKNTTDKIQAFQKVSNSSRSRYFGGGETPSSFHIKETLISWNIFGNGTPEMEANVQLLEYYRGFEEVCRLLLPSTLGFREFSIRNFEIVMICDSGDFIIDGCSGGLSALLDIAWQIYMFSTDSNKDFTVIVDEIENHLHPTMQRQLLPSLMKAFPSVRFVVSTHSPLIVGSSKESHIYALRKTTDNKVYSEKLDFENKALTASEILDEVLGVSFTMPIWAEEELKSVIAKYSKLPINKDNLNGLKESLLKMGLEDLVPQGVLDLALAKNNDTST